MKYDLLGDIKCIMENELLSPMHFYKMKGVLGYFLKIFKLFDYEMTSGVVNNYHNRRISRGSYCYILCAEIKKHLGFPIFCRESFYIGKGLLERCFSHLLQAKDSHAGLSIDNVCSIKLDKITDSWMRGKGVLVVQGFGCSTDKESFNREAAIIHFLGLENLANIIKGHLNGKILSWSDAKLHNYGMFLMFILYNKCFYECLKPLKIDDIKNKVTRPKKC